MNNKNADVKLSFIERFGYGLGDYAGNLVCSAISAFLLVYYTNVVGANAAVAASIIAVSKFLDGISDLVMGYIVDHTHSRFGKARPWILRLCIPLVISTVLMFSVPAGIKGSVQIVYMFLTYNLVSTIFYTGINVPYATLHGLMTTNQYERGLLGNFRMLLATAGTITINTVVLKLTGYFGDGNIYSQKGWTITFIILMIIFVVLNLFVFSVCKERVVEQDAEDGQQNQVSFVKGLLGLVKNRYWLIMVFCLFAIYFMMSCFFGSALYFAQYNMGNEGYYAMIANLLSIAQIVTMFFTPLLMKKLSKKTILMVGILIALAGFICTGFTTSYPVLCVLSAVKGIGFGCCSATVFGCLQDTITYGEWYNGYGTAGMGNAASSFSMKVGSGVGTAVLGWVLSAGGFDAAKAIQGNSALTAISVSFVWLPAVAILLTTIGLLFYDLDKKYPKIMADLAEGRHRTDKENKENED